MEGNKSDDELNANSDPLYKSKRRTRSFSKLSASGGKEQGEKLSRKQKTKSKQIVDEYDLDEKSDSHNGELSKNRADGNVQLRNASSSTNNATGIDIKKQKSLAELVDEKPGESSDGAGEFVDVEGEEKASAAPAIETVQSMDELLGIINITNS